ncbi:MAG: 30S ribosomal protein S7 [Anaerolineae bacterium]
MPRRGQVPRREVLPDPKYGSVQVASFINRLMKGGKKSLAARILYSSFDLIEERTGRSPLNVFGQAVKNATPKLEVRPRRVGGATYQVPVEIRGERGQSLAMRWLIQTARQRSGKSMAEKLANELLDAAQGVGATIKKKDDTHKMAEANKAFAHYRW